MTAQSLAAFILLATLTPIADPADRAPVPDDVAIERAVEDLRTVYKAAFAKKSAAETRALAANLLQLGLDTRGNPAARFALFREAADLAARGGDPALAVKAATQLATEFRVDPLGIKVDTLEKAAVAAADGSSHRAVVGAALTAADEAVKADRYEEADRFAALAVRAGGKTKDEAVAKRAAARGAEIREIAAAFATTRPAGAKFKLDPKDAGAARSVGRFRCLFKGDWAGGLPLLAGAGDGPLSDLARRDLDSPAKAAVRVALADAYWERAGGENGTVALSLRRRAAHWYRLALPELGGLARERPVKRVEEADPTDRWGHLDLTNGGVGDDFVRVNLQSQIATWAEPSGPVEIRVVARTKGNNIRLHGPNGACVILNWEVNARELRVTRPDGVAGKLESGSLATAPVKPLTPDLWYSIRWRLTPTQIDVWVDDKLVFTEKGRKYDLSTRSPVRVGACEHPVDVKSVSISPIK
ncbi:MAG: hypothetical protein JWO38_4644 [Gemmataceae bacterium]|nr:hypothetical protein [Gemmataceae bacterium]